MKSSVLIAAIVIGWVPGSSTFAQAPNKGLTKDAFLEAQKLRHEENGWKFSQEKMEQMFSEMDADQNGVVTGAERKAYWNSHTKQPATKSPSPGSDSAPTPTSYSPTPGTAAADSTEGESRALDVPLFSEAGEDVIPLEKRSRRKFGNALIADLDQDGQNDLVLTEHAQRARLFWNNGGTFSEGADVAKGDTHGIAAGDFDQDGRMDLIVTPGGGGGKKLSFPMAFHFNRDRNIETGAAFDNFQSSRGRAAKLFDADNDGDLDFVTTSFEGVARGSDINFLYNNTGKGKFELVGPMLRAQRMGFRALVTDFNNDGVFDVLLYGGEDIVVAKGEGALKFSDVTEQTLGTLRNINFVSSISEIDFDNDGDFDLFVTRADHPFGQKTYFDAEHGRFAFFARGKEMKFDDLKIEGDFKFENLQMAYPDFDVFVGAESRKLEFKGDQHGHHDFVLKPAEAEGWTTDRDQHNRIVVRVGSSPNGQATASGASLTVKAGGKTYKRVVGSSPASFSTDADAWLHVGLGAENKIDQATVRWTNGETQELKIDAVNQTVIAGKID